MKIVTKKDLALIILFSLTFVFNLCFFNQFDVILHNQSEFGLSVGEVAWFFLLVGAAIAIFLIVALLLLCKFCQVGYKITLCTLFGLTLATYAQVLFFNGNSMNIIDGSAVFTGVSTFAIIFNCLIFVTIIGLPNVFMFAFRKKQAVVQKIILLLCIVILGMQLVGLITTAANIKGLNKDAKLYYFSVDDYLQVSPNENIIVFMMDRLSTQYTERVFNRWGTEATQIFDGFTWYKNNLSEFGQTFPSVSKTLTGVEFTKSQPQTEYLPYAWENNQVFKALKKHDYRINGLLDYYCSYTNIQEVLPYFDNIKKAPSKTIKINTPEVFKKTNKLSLLRNMPFAIKSRFAIKNYSNLSNVFVNLTGSDGYYPKSASAQTDLFYYQAIKDKKLNPQSAKNTFSFVHLHSAHDPFMYDENLQEKYSTGIYSDEQAYGSMKILNEYFNQLKNLRDNDGVSIFDKSTIIVMADHGTGNHTSPDVPGSNGGAYASLLIKRAGETADIPMYTNETAQMSNRNFAATILKLLGEDCDDNSYFDIDPEPKTDTDVELEQTRYFYHASWTGWDGDFQSLTKLTGLSTIQGDAYQSSSWQSEYY